MSRGFGIDFGTHNTVVAACNDDGPGTGTLEFGQATAWVRTGQEQVPLVRSIIHLRQGAPALIGREVTDRLDLMASNLDVCKNLKTRIRHQAGSFTTSYMETCAWEKAAAMFLGRLIRHLDSHGLRDSTPIVITHPVDTYERYTHWLENVVKGETGFANIQTCPEPLAAILGYGETPLEAKQNYLVADFGAGTLDLAYVRLTSPTSLESKGSEGIEFAGNHIDEFLEGYIIGALGKTGEDLNGDLEFEESVRTLKEKLSARKLADFLHEDAHGRAITVRVERATLETFLDSQLRPKLEEALADVLQQARIKSFSEGDIKAILLTGGSASIPWFQRFFQDRFGVDRVRFETPLDAVARGAALFAKLLAENPKAGAHQFVQDRIQHTYQYRYRVRGNMGEPAFRDIISAGEAYPYTGQTQIWKADRGERTRLDLALFEYAPETGERVPLNEGNPFPIPIRPKGELEITFHVDHNRHLHLTARDRASGQVTLDRARVIQLPGGG